MKRIVIASGQIPKPMFCGRNGETLETFAVEIDGLIDHRIFDVGESVQIVVRGDSIITDVVHSTKKYVELRRGA